MAMTIRNTVQSAPGVYVYEVPSGSAPILGAGTSTAAFIGVFPDTVLIPEPNPEYNPNTQAKDGSTSVNKSVGELIGRQLTNSLTLSITKLLPGTVLGDEEITALVETGGSVVVEFSATNETKSKQLLVGKIMGENIACLDASGAPINLHYGQTLNDKDAENIIEIITNKSHTEKIRLLENLDLPKKAEEAKKTLKNRILAQFFHLKQANPCRMEIPIERKLTQIDAAQIVTYSTEQTINIKGILPYNNKTFPSEGSRITEEVKLCTNFGEFKKFFGDFSTDEGQNILAHAVYGFFRNGGSRCYVVRVNRSFQNFSDSAQITNALENFAAIDEIAIVAAPGITDKSCLQAIADYIVKEPVKDWIAVFDSPKEVPNQENLNPLVAAADTLVPGKSAYAALYYPWIQVFDPATKLQKPEGDGLKLVPPSGHIAGIYARVDSQRAVHKAPANEPVLGALGLTTNITKAHQGELNKNGINCIRNLNGNYLVWGARTLGGDANGEFMYLNVRRLFNYLKKSIDQGTQWTVFEPNSPELWAKIRRNVTSFLMTVWRSGALFGNTPEQAFYVKCDEETNPPELRDRGQVVIEIGVAVVKPAEFVIFNLSQWAGPGK